MLISSFQDHPYLTLSLLAVLINIPLGYIRENCPRFSFKWFFWIHASIPFIVYLRIALGTSKLFIPMSIFLAIIGQMIGSRWRHKTMTTQEWDKLNQIDLTVNEPRRFGNPNLRGSFTVVLLNMGGPRTNEDVRDFQIQLFSDARLIRFPLSKLLQPLFARLLSTLRNHNAKARYQLIGGGSPIFKSTKQQAQALDKELKQRGIKNTNVTFSFNYSEPLPETTIEEVKKSGKEYILPLSLYPHYSEATTGSNIHYLKKAAQKIYPEVQFLPTPSYYLHDGYIQAFVDRIHEQITPEAGENLDDYYLLFSAHSLPLYFLKEGDKYPFQIAQTVGQVVTKLGRKDNWSISYQSAVGPLQWVKPYTENMIAALAKRGVKKLLIVPISFVTDHIETSCEIDIEYRHMAENLGIHDFRMSKAIECHAGFIKALADCVEDVVAHEKSSQRKVEKEKVIC